MKIRSQYHLTHLTSEYFDLIDNLKIEAGVKLILICNYLIKYKLFQYISYQLLYYITYKRNTNI